MHDLIEKRLEELKRELEIGQKMLAELDSKRENTRHTILRISGAIQVLEELIQRDMDSETEPGQTTTKV